MPVEKEDIPPSGTFDRSYLSFEIAQWFRVIAVIIVSGLSAAQISLYLVPPGVILGFIAFHIYSWRAHPRVHSNRRSIDDRHLINGCVSGSIGRWRDFYHWLPKDPRCRVCLAPFAGLGRLLGIQASDKNPNLCRFCFEGAPVGSYDESVGILFADIRGFTSWSEIHTPAQTSKLVSTFYDISCKVLSQDDALVEYVGDQVMAIYLETFPSLGSQSANVMVNAARRLMKAYELSPIADEGLTVGIGIHVGIAAVGNVGKGSAKDFTAVGDVVNTAARLQSSAGGGEIIISESVFDRWSGDESLTVRRELNLKGKTQAMAVRVLTR